MKWKEIINSYQSGNENFLLDDFKTPKTPENARFFFDRSAFFRYLKFQIGDFEAPSGNIRNIILSVKSWTTLKLPEWQRILDALEADYEALWNYNRYDEEEINESEKERMKNKSVETNEVAAFDSTDAVLKNRVSGNASQNQKRNNDKSRTLHSYGNIGVMSTQDLLKQEIEVAQISIYDIIIDDFKSDMCILCY